MMNFAKRPTGTGYKPRLSKPRLRFTTQNEKLSLRITLDEKTMLASGFLVGDRVYVGYDATDQTIGIKRALADGFSLSGYAVDKGKPKAAAITLSESVLRSIGIPVGIRGEWADCDGFWIADNILMMRNPLHRDDLSVAAE